MIGGLDVVGMLGPVSLALSAVYGAYRLGRIVRRLFRGRRP